MTSKRNLSRQVDKVRKRYKRDIAKYSKIAESSKGHRKALAESMVRRAEKGIESLKYDRSKGGYSQYVVSKINTLEFESRKENRKAIQTLTSIGGDSRFYAATKELWHMKDNGLSTNENIVLSLQEMGYDVRDMGDAISVVSKLTGIDFFSPFSPGNAWERYDEEEILAASMAIHMAISGM